ncbi:MAG: Tm-1-like ATP-binding domain-containing protein [Planctomycetaceae bacterium]
MRALPIGLPRRCIDGRQCEHRAPYVDCSDITLMYSVVDVAGLNTPAPRPREKRRNGRHGPQPTSRPASCPCVGMTMFGVTTPCVTRVREPLEQHGFDCLVFHATGAGGRAMELSRRG